MGNSFVSLLNKDIKSRPWYISNNILPKSGTLLFGGHSKTYKSFLALNMARNIVFGEHLWNCPFVHCEPGKVLLIEQEIGERGLQKRGSYIFYNTDLKTVEDKFFYRSKDSKLLLNLQEGQKIMFDLIKEHKPNVLILDPIGKLQTYDENSAQEIGELFNLFERFKKVNPEEEMSVVLSHHFKKPPGGEYAKGYDHLDPHNFRGSMRWFSDPDTIITVQKTKETSEPWKWANLRLRFTLRQDESPDDMVFTFNEQELKKNSNIGDNLIRYKYSITNEGAIKSVNKGTNTRNTNSNSTSRNSSNNGLGSNNNNAQIRIKF